MSLLPIIAIFLTNVALKRCSWAASIQAVLCLLALIDVVELLGQVRRGVVQPADLMVAIKGHLERYASVYGNDAVRPKHHYALHLPDMLRRFGMLFSCWVHERRHRLVKQYTRDRRNTTSYEVGTAEDCAIDHLDALGKPWLCSKSCSRRTRR